MKELDLLKKAWQKETHSFQQVTESEIYTMFHKRSSSIVKWILIISIVEVCFWSLTSVFFNTDEYMKQLHAENLNPFFKGLTFVNYAVILFFIYKFYKNYLKISTTATTKQLMQDILQTRKTVRYYVYYNLTMIVLSFIAGLFIAFEYNPQMGVLRYKIAHESDHHILLITIVMMSGFVLLFFGIFWAFYRLLYGILLRKLNKNYKELQKIDL
jgi:hypothetical protein